MQCNEVRNHFADYVKEQLSPFVQARLARHLEECASCRTELDGLTDMWAKLGTIPTADSPVSAMNARFREALEDYRQTPRPAARQDVWYWTAGIAASVALVVLGSFFFFGEPVEAASATVETVEGALYRTWDGTTDRIEPGAAIELGEELRAQDEAMLKLADGSRVEMRSNSVIWLESAIDGLRIRLRAGSVIVNAAKQRTGHLYVQTKEVTVSVIGTVFVVNAEEAGSSVAVIEGEVHVQQGANTQTLLPGEQVATTPAMVPRPMAEEISWSRNAEEHVALLTLLQTPVETPAQNVPAPRLEFDVAAIHLSKREHNGNSIDMRNERAVLDNMNTKMLIQTAYKVKDYQISGPAVLTSERYVINARAPRGTPNDQLHLMLQSLLVNRFKLVMHEESRETLMYALVQAKDGHKLKEMVQVDALPSDGTTQSTAGGGAGGGGGVGVGRPVTMSSQGTMAGFADSLSRSVDRPVVDRTGLSGRYSIGLSYLSEARIRAGESGPTLFQALEEQLGLRLEPIKAPVTHLVIDSIEKPSDN